MVHPSAQVGLNESQFFAHCLYSEVLRRASSERYCRMELKILTHMNIEYLKLVKIDHDNNVVVPEELGEEGNVREYVLSILDQINENAGDREYEFKSDEITMKTFLNNLVVGDDRDTQAMAIANRLLVKENDAQQRYRQITEIQKGILLIAYCCMAENEYKIVICKADYTEFIEEATGQKRNGLPTKKKIFKSFTANVSLNAGAFSFGRMITYDLNSAQTKYWYDEFLDLKACLNDAENTKRAFEYINSKVLAPISQAYPREYLRLWNITVGYMRSEGEFSIDHYADVILGSYHPEDEQLNMAVLSAKARELPEKWKFDRRFTKNTRAVKSKFKKEYDLTNDIKLVLNQNIPDLDRTILAHEDAEQNKYIMIRSEFGYSLAKKIENHEN